MPTVSPASMWKDRPFDRADHAVGRAEMRLEVLDFQ